MDNNLEKLTQEIKLVCNDFYNQDKLKQEYLNLKDKHKEAIRLLESLNDGDEAQRELIIKNRLSLHKMLEYYRARRNLIADMIEDEAWLYANLT